MAGKAQRFVEGSASWHMAQGKGQFALNGRLPFRPRGNRLPTGPGRDRGFPPWSGGS